MYMCMCMSMCVCMCMCMCMCMCLFRKRERVSVWGSNLCLFASQAKWLKLMSIMCSVVAIHDACKFSSHC